MEPQALQHSPLQPLVCVAVLLSLTLVGLLPSPCVVPCRRLLPSLSLEPLVLPLVLLGWLAALSCFSWMDGLLGDTCMPPVPSMHSSGDPSLASLTSCAACRKEAIKGAAGQQAGVRQTV